MQRYLKDRGKKPQKTLEPGVLEQNYEKQSR
jgi:hypothetical protein